jgi:addiction module toxin, relE/stbE family
MKYEVKFTTQFKKDLKLAKKQNKNLDKLFEVIALLSEGVKLDVKYRDHDLVGNYKGARECHIEPDWLLVYEYRNDVLVLMLYRLGSHSELFKKF